MDGVISDNQPFSNEETPQHWKPRVWNESLKIWRIAFPAIITRITGFGMIVVTQSFMGHIGAVELSSYALVQSFLVGFANGILLGMSCALETLCGQAYGAKQLHMMGLYMQRSWVVVLTTATLLIPLFAFATPIFRLLGQEEELSVVAGKIAVWFIPILYTYVFNFTMQIYLQSQLKNAINAWAASLSFVSHVILSWLFVSKLKLGISGAMGAMIISSWSVTIGQLVYVLGGWCPDTWKGFSMGAFSELLPVVKLSASSGVMICLELWYNAILVLFAGYMKNATIEIAAFSICVNVLVWQMMIFLGFLTAASVRVSNELGRGDAKAAKFSVKVIMATSLLIGLVFTILSLAFGRLLSHAFTSNKKVIKAVSDLLYFLAISVFLTSIQPVLSGVAIGGGWQAAVGFVNIACYYVVGIPIGMLLAYVAHLKVRGIWIGMICGVVFQTLVLILMTWRTNWNSQMEKARVRLNRWYVPSVQVSDETTHNN